MKRLWVTLALGCLAAPGCGRASAPAVVAAEPPPPSIEPALAPGSRLVDPRADALVLEMSRYLARAAGGRLIAASGARVYGIVTAVDRKHGAVTVALTDITAGDQVVPIITQPVRGQGGVIPAQYPVPFTVSAPFQVDLPTNVAVR